MNNNNNSNRWIAIYTKPRHEKSVLIELEKKYFEVYLPLLKKRRKWSDRKTWIEFPLFKSYLFVSSNLKDTLSIVKTPGVIKIIKFGNKIATINNKTISDIKLMIEGGYNLTPTDYFIKGEQVIVKDGPLKGLEGEVIRSDGSDWLILRIDIIQHAISVKINRGFLSKK